VGGVGSSDLFLQAVMHVAKIATDKIIFFILKYSYGLKIKFKGK
jgi:hypothetical protein